MKTPLLAALALGLLAGAGTASAQSGVSLWGIADAWVGQMDHKAGAMPNGRVSVVESGGGQASRWGVRGSEDLGGGWKASFALEQGISIANGTITKVSASDIGFNRAAWVGLSGPYGELRLGRMLTAYDALRGSTNHLYDSSGFASTGQVWSAGSTEANGLEAVSGSDYLARGNNTVMLITPVLAGFSGSVSLSLGQGATTDVAAPRLITAHAKYTDGPVRVGYSYQTERYTTGNNKFHLVAGTYDFGVARFVGAIQRQIEERVPGGQKSDELQVGLDVPFGAATVALGYAGARTKNPEGDKVLDAKGISAMGTYDLSKRTRLYVAFRKLEAERADGSTTLDAKRYGVGVTHKF